MNTIIPRPNPESFAIKPKHNPKKTPDRDQCHVRHDRVNEAALHDPRCDEFGEAITPNILVYRYCHKDAAGNGLVGVDCVCRGDCRECCNLDACTGISNDDNNL